MSQAILSPPAQIRARGPWRPPVDAPRLLRLRRSR